MPAITRTPGLARTTKVQATYVLNKIDFHPDLFYYGIHGVEALYAVMGPGCTRLSRKIEGDADVTTCTWKDGRIGVYHGMPKADPELPLLTVWGDKGTVNAAGARTDYDALIEKIAEFFHTGRAAGRPWRRRSKSSSS